MESLPNRIRSLCSQRLNSLSGKQAFHRRNGCHLPLCPGREAFTGGNMLFANFIRAKALIPEKSLTIWRQDGNGMSGSKTGAEPDSEVGVVLGQAEFAADVTADYVIALLLEIVADILAFEPEDI